MSESIFIRLFAGVPSDYFGAIPLIPFGQWLLPIGIFLLAVGVYVERGRKVEIFSLYRYGTVSNWWKRHLGKSVIFGIKTAVSLLSMVFVCDIVMGRVVFLSVWLFVKIIVLWLFHSISMAALYVLLELFHVKRFSQGVLILFEGVTFIIGCRVHAVSHMMYGMWGMYLQSSLYETGGFPVGVIIVVETVLLVSSFVIGREYVKKEINYIRERKGL